MAINKNHEFDELNGVKSAIVEKNVLPSRVAFLKELLEYNHYTVIVVATPPPKTAAAIPKEGVPAPVVAPPLHETFTVGVTDVSFNAVNAIFGRQLHTRDGHIVTLAFWQQKEATANDEVPYFE